MSDLVKISKILKNLKTDKEIYKFLIELLTESETEVLSKRWRILEMLKDGLSQRQIANDLKVSLCKVTRGAKILKDKNAVITKILKG